MVSAGLGLWLATLWVPGVVVQIYPDSHFFGIPLTQQWHLLVIFGVVLGLLNFFIKPILNLITLPLRIITLGFFGIVINAGFIWIVDYMFRELSIPILYPLLWTALIVLGLNIIILKIFIQHD